MGSTKAPASGEAIAAASNAAAEAAAHEALRALVDGLPGVVYRLRGPSGWRFEYASRGCTELLGKTPAELTAGDGGGSGLVHPDDRARVDAEVREAIEDDRPYCTTYRLTSAGAQIRWVTDQGRGVRDADGRVVAREGFLSDVTETRRLERYRSRARQLEGMTRIAAAVAHDTNNILTSLIVTADLARRTLAPGRLREDLELLLESAESAARTTKQLVSLNRGPAVGTQVADVNACARKVQELLSPLLGPGIELRLDAWKEPLVVRIDPGRMTQILRTLALNAQDAMPRGGVIEIQTELLAAHDPRARGATIPRGPKVLVSVTDTGVGMSEETLSHLFEPLAPRGAGKGRGLGLAAVYASVTDASGEIWASSVPGRGTRFDIVLPPAWLPE